MFSHSSLWLSAFLCLASVLPIGAQRLAPSTGDMMPRSVSSSVPVSLHAPGVLHPYTLPSDGMFQAAPSAIPSMPRFKVEGEKDLTVNAYMSVSPYQAEGIVTMPVTTSFTNLSPGVQLPLNYAGAMGDNVYYTLNFWETMGYYFSVVYTIDARTWQLISSVECPTPFMAQDFAYDYTTGTLYGACVDLETMRGYLGIVDPETGVCTKVADTQYVFTGLACAPDGSLYGINASGLFCAIDKATGQSRVISYTTARSEFLTSATIDPKTGLFIYPVLTRYYAYMFTITPEGECTQRYVMPGLYEFQGLYSDWMPQATAPGRAQSIAVSFEGTSLKGDVTFVAPIATYDGTPGEGEITWTLTLDGSEVATGTCTYGESVTAPGMRVESNGFHTFGVTFSNASGRGEILETRDFYGVDTPQPPASLTVQRRANFYMTWPAAPTTGVNGGEIPAEDIEYVLTRYPDNYVMGTTSDTKLESPVPPTGQLIKYSFAIQTKVGEQLSEPRYATFTWTQGNIMAPYENCYTTEQDQIGVLSAIDTNQDGNQWRYATDHPYAFFTTGTARAANDYLVMKGASLTADNVYKFRLTASATVPGTTERIGMKILNSTAGANVAVQGEYVMAQADNPVHSFWRNVKFAA